MELYLPPPELVLAGQRAMKTIALADGALDDSERSFLEAVQHMFRTPVDVDALEPIEPDELAASVVSPFQAAIRSSNLLQTRRGRWGFGCRQLEAPPPRGSYLNRRGVHSERPFDSFVSCYCLRSRIVSMLELVLWTSNDGGLGARLPGRILGRPPPNNARACANMRIGRSAPRAVEERVP